MWPPLTDDRATTRGDPAAGVQLSSHAVAHHYQVGPRFVQACLEAVASTQLAQRGLSLEESGPYNLSRARSYLLSVPSDRVVCLPLLVSMLAWQNIQTFSTLKPGRLSAAAGTRRLA